ncbi:MAG: hypothetical protein H6563_10895 [Lewinellaceae bacterium]|nr:hypothetical protein [Lewinellaceae bacterium]
MKNTAPYLMLLLRVGLFVLFQATIALLFYILGSEAPWVRSEGYWAIAGLLANGVTFLLLVKLFRKEGVRYFDNFRFVRKDWWKDLLIAIGLLILAGPISTFPNIWLAKGLLGSTEASAALFFRPLPLWVIIISFLWPFAQGLVELPTYFAYAMPRIEKQLNNGWIAWALASFFLAFQHAGLPLIFDLNFILWRIGMFLPFAFFIGLCLKIRPRLFPYLMISHALMDLVVVLMIPVKG